MRLASYVGMVSLALLPSTGLGNTSSLDQEVVNAVECFRDSEKTNKISSGTHTGRVIYKWQHPSNWYDSVIYTNLNQEEVDVHDTVTMQNESYHQQKLGGQGLSSEEKEKFYNLLKKFGKICYQQSNP